MGPARSERSVRAWPSSSRKEAEGEVVERAERAEAAAAGGDEVMAGALDLRGLFAGEGAEAGFVGGAIDRGVTGAARGGATVLAKARREPDGRAFEPTRAGGLGAGGALGERLGVDAEVARGREREGRAPEPVAIAVGRSFGEPAGEGGEIGGAVGAAGAAVVELGDGGEERGDGRARAGAQEFGLGGSAVGDEPAAQARPAVAPTRDSASAKRIGGGVECVGEFAAGGGSAKARATPHVSRRRISFGNAAGGDDEFADEVFQIVDQLFLIGEEGFDGDCRADRRCAGGRA